MEQGEIEVLKLHNICRFICGCLAFEFYNIHTNQWGGWEPDWTCKSHKAGD